MLPSTACSATPAPHRVGLSPCVSRIQTDSPHATKWNQCFGSSGRLWRALRPYPSGMATGDSKPEAVLRILCLGDLASLAALRPPAVLVLRLGLCIEEREEPRLGGRVLRNGESCRRSVLSTRPSHVPAPNKSLNAESTVCTVPWVPGYWQLFATDRRDLRHGRRPK